jgi:hypothetical protein
LISASDSFPDFDPQKVKLSTAQKSLLQRYSQHLKSNGVFVVRICDQRKHGGVINLISRNFQILETAPVDAGMILVFSQEHPVEGLPE